jgi:hypothetical protein
MDTQAKPELLTEKVVERLNAVAVDVAVVKSNYATREDIARTHEAIAETRGDIANMESSLLKWFFATTLTLASLAFVAARYIH